MKIKRLAKTDAYDEKEVINYSVVNQAEQRLTEALVKGDLRQVNKIINSVLMQYYQKGSTEFLVYANSRLLSVFSLLLQKLPTNDAKGYIKLLSKVKLRENSLNCFFSLADYFCNSVGLNNREEDRLVGEIIEYINANYSDSSLNVNALGYIFNRAPSYISCQFKKSTGCMLNRFITETRIQQAKMLLCTDEKIESISSVCGFSRSNSFRRIFKKYTGMTPTAYKEALEDEK